MMDVCFRGLAACPLHIAADVVMDILCCTVPLAGYLLLGFARMLLRFAVKPDS